MIRSLCAIYARYSTDKQSHLSIEDQVRKCREYAACQGWEVLDEHVYSDEAMSGSSSDLPGLRGLTSAISLPDRPFEVLLVDDSSRLSRHQVTAMQLFERFNFASVRVVAVSQGIDSSNEQADVLMTVHGLVDSLYVKELAKKTHRGLEGKVIRGFHAGGHCFGFRNVTTSDGVRLEVNELEAPIVRRIFELSAAGSSLKSIAKVLNSENVAPPRGRRKHQPGGSWSPTAIREMLRRELYIGRVIWNRSRFVKRPGTNKRVQRPRPRQEWTVLERPELRMVADELWQAVQERLDFVKKTYGRRGPAGLLGRAASSPHLLTGFLKCGQCGSDMTIVVGIGKGRHPKYGCPKHFNRGACTNDLTEREDWLEENIFNGLQNEVLKPEMVEFAIEEFGRQLKQYLSRSSVNLDTMRQRRAALEGELRRLTDAMAVHGFSDSLSGAIRKRETELAELTSRLSDESLESVINKIEEIRKFVTGRLNDIPGLLRSDVARARTELAKHVTEIRMIPHRSGSERYYVADGGWSLLGGYAQVPLPSTDCKFGMVAGAGFEPATFGL